MANAKIGKKYTVSTKNDLWIKNEKKSYDGANTSWINAKNYSAEDCMNTIDAICCDFQG